MIWLKALIQRTAIGSEKPTVDRVIAIDKQEDVVVTFDINDRKALPVVESLQALLAEMESGRAKIAHPDPFIAFIKVKDSDLKQSYIDRRDKAFASIEDLVQNHKWELFEKAPRGRLVRAAAKEHKKTRHEILRRLRLYWRMGMHPNALLPDYRETGGRGKAKPVTSTKRGRKTELEKATKMRIGVNMTEVDAKRLGKGYRTYYLKSKERHTEEQAYKITLRRWYRKRGLNGKWTDLPPKEQLPTQEQFRYWGRKYTPRAERERLRSGSRYPLEKRPRIHTTKKLYYGPGSEFQIDATRYSVYLVSLRNRRRIVGTPVVYIIRDCFSRMIVGFVVTLEGPSWLGAMLALETVTLDKVELCKKYGIEIEDWEWPCKYLCQLIKADRGELLSKQALRIVKELGIFKSNTPAFRGDLKGLVENTFGVMEGETVDWVPGAHYDQANRQGPDYRLDATMNIVEFTRLIIYYILKYNTETKIEDYQLEPAMLADGVEPIPLDLWNWGIENLSGELPTEDQDYVRFCLLPEKHGSIAREGIYFEKIWYSSVDDRLWDKYHQALRGRIAVKVIYDPRCVDMIYVRLEPRGEAIPCYLREDYEVYKGYTFDEYKDELSVRDQEDQLGADRRLRAGVRHQDRIDAEVNAALQRKSESGESALTKTEQLSNIRANRKEERTDIRRQENWLQGEQGDAHPASEIEPDEEYIPKYNPHGKLRKLLEEHKQEVQNDHV